MNSLEWDNIEDNPYAKELYDFRKLYHIASFNEWAY